MKFFQFNSKKATFVVAAFLVFFSVVADNALLWGRTDPAARENEIVASAAVEEGEIDAKRSLSPEDPTEFQALELVLTYEAPRSLRLDKNELDGFYGDFLCEYVGEERRDLDANRQETTRTWKLYPQKSGALELPPIPATLSYEDAGKNPFVLVVPAQKITVPAVDANVASDEGFRYILEPVPTISPTKIAALIVAALLVALVAAAPRLRKKLRNAPFFDAESPYELAVRRLNELKGSRIYAENSPEFYLIVDDVLRRFLNDEFHIAAREKTSSEILGLIDGSNSSSTEDSAGESQVANASNEVQLSRAERMEIARNVLKETEIRQTLRDVLGVLDRVKFAKRPSSFADASALFQAIRDVVDNSNAAFQTETNRALNEKRKQAELDAAAQKSN